MGSRFPLNCSLAASVCMVFRPAAPVVFALLSILFTAPPLKAQIPIGHVLEIKGDWYLYQGVADVSSGHKVSQWQDVPPGGVMRVKSPSRDDYITVVDRNLNIVVRRKCERLNSCYEPIVFSRAVDESRGGGALLASKAWALLWGEGNGLSLFSKRGVATRLVEDVAPILNGRVDLRGVMQHMPKGKYSLASEKQGRKISDNTTVFDWDPGAPTVIAVGNRKSSLYEIDLVESSDPDSLIQNVSMVVLFCVSSDCPVALSSFQKTRSLTDGWANAASAETIHAFLRAYLEELVEVLNPSKK